MDRSSFSGKIADILLRRGAIDQATLQQAMEESQQQGQRLEECLTENNLVSDIDMTLAISEYVGIPPIKLERFTPNSILLDLVPKDTWKNHIAMPVTKMGKTLTVALGDPFNMASIDELQSLTGLQVNPLVASEREVNDVLQRFQETQSADLEDVFKDVADSDDVEVGHINEEEMSVDQLMDSADEAPVIRIVNSIMVEAMRRHASDIHVEPTEKNLRLRYRCDGDMTEVPSPPKNLQNAIISRIKIMSDMNIAERRIPQDGRFKIRALGKEVDVRVSLLPLIHGEKICMRILDKSNLAPSLNALGLDPNSLDKFIYAIGQPHGIILVTGPTGSGKTTTLYSCLQDLNKADVNIVTTEDPVEYELYGINQVQINEGVGLTFASALRSILRQDPDICLVGEIRDGETAAIAVKAALTGHLVLSTLHTNDAAGAITRLVDMGIEPFLLASSVVMTQAQRLYKKLCPACKRPRDLPDDVFRVNNIDPKLFEGVQMYEPKGCPKCNGSGMKGRGALMEILLVDNPIKQLVLKNANAKQISDRAVKSGMRTLRVAGFERVKEGLTTIEEILRVAGGEGGEED